MAKLFFIIFFCSFSHLVSCQRHPDKPILVDFVAGVGTTADSIHMAAGAAEAVTDAHGIDGSHSYVDNSQDRGTKAPRVQLEDRTRDDNYNRAIDPATGRYNPALDPSSASYDPSRQSSDSYVQQPYYEQASTQAPSSNYDPYAQDPYNRQPQPDYDASRQDPRYDQSNQDPNSDASRQDPNYDPYRSDPRYAAPTQDPRYGGYQDPRYDSSRQDPPYDADRQPGYDSRSYNYPPTLKTLVMSETNVYLWWNDPRFPQGGRKQAAQGAQPVKYTIKYSKSYGGGQEQTKEVSSRELNLQDLEPGTDYSFSVKSDASDQWSAPVRNRTLDQLPSNAPANIKVEPRDREATITISPPDGFKGVISQYLFLYAPSGGGAGNRVWTEQTVSGYSATGGPVTVTIRNLQPAEEYFYTVQALNSRGSSPFSEIASFKTTAYPDYNRPYDTTRSPYDRYPNTPVNYPAYPTPDAYASDPYAAYRQSTEDPYAAYRTTEDPYARYETPDYYNRDQNRDNTYRPYWESATAAPGGGVHAGGSAASAGYYDSRTGGSQSGQASAWGSGQNVGSAVHVVPGVSGSQSRASSSSQSGLFAPTDLRIDPMDDGDVIVLFTPPSTQDIKGFEVLYSYDSSAPEEQWQKEEVPPQEHQVIIPNLTTNTNVYIKVRAFNDRGKGDFSEMLTHYVHASGQAGGDQSGAAQGGDQDRHDAGAQSEHQGADNEYPDQDDPSATTPRS